MTAILAPAGRKEGAGPHLMASVFTGISISSASNGVEVTSNKQQAR